MGMYWSIKSCSEDRVIEMLRRQALYRQVVALLTQRAATFALVIILSTIPAWPETMLMTICFTPGQPCTRDIVMAVNNAHRTILVQAYSFTSAPIATALRDAHRRGVQVQVILDKSQRSEKYSSADFLVNQGVSVLIDASHAIAHNKVIIVDGDTLITGSFNFTKAAQERNAENLLIIRDAALAAAYTHNWEQHREHSQPYSRRR